MGIFKPSVSKILLTIVIFLYPLIIGYLQVIPFVEKERSTLVYPFTLLANFLLSIFPDNTLVSLFTWIIGELVVFYLLSCLIVSFFGSITQKKTT